VYAAHRVVAALRRGRFRDPGLRTRGPLGLGTDFESIRDYLPDDDVRQINWLATARVGRPMSNSYRIEQDRELVCLLDAGRLMGAPAGGEGVPRTRLDAAVDAATAVALVADQLGDRVGAIAFDAQLQRVVRPRHRGAEAVVRALYDIQPRGVDADYAAAFQAVVSGKRALVLVFSDLLDEAAARPLLDGLPVLARRHHVVVASATDPDLREALTREPRDELDVYAAAAALDVLAARERAAAQLRRVGADVLEAPPDRLSAACVAAYLRAKRRVRL
jgi:uncharacterized protein (DUF58 family)